MKASPLLRAWLRRLDGLGVTIKTRHLLDRICAGWRTHFRDRRQEAITVKADAALFALGGASWPKLGSDGLWAETFNDVGVADNAACFRQLRRRHCVVAKFSDRASKAPR